MQKINPIGCVIAIEGIDHSFKETNALELKKVFDSKGLHSLILSFPDYSSNIGQNIYRILHNGTREEKETLPSLFLKEQEEMLAYIKELRDKGVIVILDRYFISNIVYNYDTIKISDVESKFYDVLDYTLYFDMDPDLITELIKKRAEDRGEELDMNESDMNKLKKTRINYLKYLASRANTGAVGKVAIVETYNGDTIRSKQELSECMKVIGHHILEELY